MAMLVDSSVWARHLRSPNPALMQVLQAGEVLIHEFIVGELLLGSIKRGGAFMQSLQMLRQLPQVPHIEAVAFVRLHRLEGSGIGWIDAHLLASAAQAGEGIWTFDASLADACRNSGVLVRDS
jgi:predicted nucleic acid-binding protein